MLRNRLTTIRRATGDRRYMLVSITIGVIGFATSALVYLGGTVTGIDAILPAAIGIVVAVLLGFVVGAQLRDHVRRKTKPRSWYQDAAFYLVRGAWPKSDEKLLPEISSTESVLEWRDRVRELPVYKRATDALLRMRQAALDGEEAMKVWGRTPTRSVMTVSYDVDETKLFEPLNSKHWKTHEVEPLQLIFKPEQVHTLTSEWAMIDDESACSLMVSKAQIEVLARKQR